MLKGFLLLVVIVILLFAGPLLLLFTGKVKLQGDYRTANRESAHIAPDPATTPEALVQVYSGRAFKWRGAFSVHTWVAVKPANAKSYRIYQVLDWRVAQGLPAVSIEEDMPDRYWFNSRPQLVAQLKGAPATAAIAEIDKAVKDYPYPDEYRLWPGPNSNTFTAYLVRHAPQLRAALPTNAIGKDYLPHGGIWAKAPSGTGYQVSLYGVLGAMLAKQEGLEINILGLVFGINPRIFALALPGIGQIGGQN